jgi:hypothetical protein
MRDISVLFEELVSQINGDIKITSVVGTTFNTCDTKWMRKGKKIWGLTNTDVLKETKIKTLIKDTSFELEDNTIVKGIYLSPPFALVGTKIATNNEFILKDRDLLKKTPLIWLLESHNEKVYNTEASLERDIKMRIIFLDETNVAQYKTTDHRLQVVEPMIALQEEFIKVLNKKPIYKTLKDFNRNVFSRFGVESDKGVIQNILDADLSGIVIEFTTSKYKEPCKC